MLRIVCLPFFFHVGVALPLIAGSGTNDLPEEVLVDIDAERLEAAIWKGVYAKEPVSILDLRRGYGMVEEVWDARLMGIYVKLAALLDERAGALLAKEQIKWDSERDNACVVDIYKEGSESYLRSGACYIKMTKARVADLEERLKALLPKSDG